MRTEYLRKSIANLVYGGDLPMDKEKMKTKLKIRFYFMSLWLLFLLITIVTICKPKLIGDETLKEIMILSIKANIISITSLGLSIISILMAFLTKYEWGGVSYPPYEIVEIKNENYEYLTFLSTYIIPLICIDFDNIRYVFVLFILLIVIGAIFVKMDLYYGNPTLALLGYKIYRATLKDVNAPDGVILISKSKLTKDKSIKWIPLDEYVWVAKETK